MDAGDAGIYSLLPAAVTIVLAFAVRQVIPALFAGVLTGSVVLVAAGTAPLTFQWRKDGVDITGETASSYTIAAVATGDEADYSVFISSGCGDVTSAAATLTVADHHPVAPTRAGLEAGDGPLDDPGSGASGQHVLGGDELLGPEITRGRRFEDDPVTRRERHLGPSGRPAVVAGLPGFMGHAGHGHDLERIGFDPVAAHECH